MAISDRISAGSRGGRLLVEDAVALRVGDLRSRWGWLRTLDLDAADGSTVKLSLDPAEGATYAWVLAEHWPVGSRWATARYGVELVSRPAPLGGRRWWLACPETGALALALFLSPDGSRLACRAALGLAHASQRQRAPARAAARAERIRAEIGGDGSRRPAGMWRSTFDRRVAELVRLDGVAASR